jgi:hypothetical protein
VDGAGEVGSREPRSSAELEIDMIEQLPNCTALIVLYVLLQDKLKVLNITKQYCQLVSSIFQINLCDTKITERLPPKACGYQDNKFKSDIVKDA